MTHTLQAQLIRLGVIWCLVIVLFILLRWWVSRLPDTSPNLALLVNRLGIIALLIFGLLATLVTFPIFQVPAVAVIIYSVALPAAVLAVLQPTLAGFLVLAFAPFDVGDTITASIPGNPDVTGEVVAINLHTTIFWDGEQLVVASNIQLSQALIRHKPRRKDKYPGVTGVVPPSAAPSQGNASSMSHTPTS